MFIALASRRKDRRVYASNGAFVLFVCDRGYFFDRDSSKTYFVINWVSFKLIIPNDIVILIFVFLCCYNSVKMVLYNASTQFIQHYFLL